MSGKFSKCLRTTWYIRPYTNLPLYNRDQQPKTNKERNKQTSHTNLHWDNRDQQPKTNRETNKQTSHTNLHLDNIEKQTNMKLKSTNKNTKKVHALIPPKKIRGKGNKQKNKQEKE